MYSELTIPKIEDFKEGFLFLIERVVFQPDSNGTPPMGPIFEEHTFRSSDWIERIKELMEIRMIWVRKDDLESSIEGVSRTIRARER